MFKNLLIGTSYGGIATTGKFTLTNGYYEMEELTGTMEKIYGYNVDMSLGSVSPKPILEGKELDQLFYWSTYDMGWEGFRVRFVAYETPFDESVVPPELLLINHTTGESFRLYCPSWDTDYATYAFDSSYGGTDQYRYDLFSPENSEQIWEIQVVDVESDTYSGTITTYNTNGVYPISITRDGVQIYSLTLPSTTSEYLSYNVRLKVGDVIEGEGNAKALTVSTSSNIEFHKEISSCDYGDYISKLTVSTIQNDFYFYLTAYMPGMAGGSVD